MTFENPEYLQWLIILPFFLVIYGIRSSIRKKNSEKWLGSQSSLLIAGISPLKRKIKMTLKMLTLCFLLIALARPQSAGEKIQLQNKGIYILLLIDISNSMLAEDIKPNRLRFMKQEISHFLDISSGDEIALAVFAHSAMLISPFTRDLTTIKSYLNDLSTDYLSRQGTHFERALKLGAGVFDKIKVNKNEQITKAIVIASDGEDHSPKTKSLIKDLLNKKQIRIFTLSFGTKKGAVIPVKDHKGQIKEYKKDHKGELVITKLKVDSLKNFANWGKGSYYHVSYGGRAIEGLRQDLNQLNKNQLEESSYRKKRENYQWFLILALLTALIEFMLTSRSYIKRSEGKKVN